MDGHARNVVNPHEAVEKIEQAAAGGETPKGFKPEVFLPGGAHSITDAALNLGRLLGRAQKYYYRGNAVVRVIRGDEDKPTLTTVKPAALTSSFEDVATIVKAKQVDGKWIGERAICPEQMAKQILEADHFRESLPVLRVICPCPVLIERDGVLVEIVGYDRKSGIMAGGERSETVPLEDAVKLLSDVLKEFHFATPADRSRALAAMITPALIFSGMLKGRAPLDLGEADKSQTGKGFRNKITAAIYSQKVKTIAQQENGVGGLDEAFDTAILSGANFVCLDNIKGKVNSSKIESAMTEDTYNARVPYQAGVTVDPRRTFIMMTSNKADVSQDLANRSSCVRLLKRADDHNFQEFPAGDVLDNVRANQPQYLGAVFAVVRAWHAAGKPKTRETAHDFRKWLQKLDWIVQNIFDAPPLMQGHKATQERMTNPTLGWMREVILVMRERSQMDEWLRTYHLVDALSESDVTVPGLKEEDDLSDDAVRKRVNQATGRKLAIAFRASDEILMDGFICRRKVYVDPFSSNKSREYFFSSQEEAPF